MASPHHPPRAPRSRSTSPRAAAVTTSKTVIDELLSEHRSMPHGRITVRPAACACTNASHYASFAEWHEAQARLHSCQSAKYMQMAEDAEPLQKSDAEEPERARAANLMQHGKVCVTEGQQLRCCGCVPHRLNSLERVLVKFCESCSTACSTVTVRWEMCAACSTVTLTAYKDWRAPGQHACTMGGRPIEVRVSMGTPPNAQLMVHMPIPAIHK